MESRYMRITAYYFKHEMFTMKNGRIISTTNAEILIQKRNLFTY